MNLFNVSDVWRFILEASCGYISWDFSSVYLDITNVDADKDMAVISISHRITVIILFYVR